MKEQAQAHGIMAEFLTPESVLRATRRARQAGYRDMDAYTPYPIAGLAAELGLRKSRLPSVVLVGGLVGASAGYFMQFYANAVNYPLNVGGKPYHSWPAFVPVTFEMLILVASLCAFFGLLLLNGLPRPHHPVFHVDRFTRASQDRFFLCIEASDPNFDLTTTAEFMAGLEPHGSLIFVPLQPSSATTFPSDGGENRPPAKDLPAGEG